MGCQTRVLRSIKIKPSILRKACYKTIESDKTFGWWIIQIVGCQAVGLMIARAGRCSYFHFESTDMAMRKRAEVIIIGAGVIGTSIAYHLAKLGCRDVIVLEKEDTIGSGSTAKAAGAVRQQFCTEVNIGLSMESVKSFERFEEEIGSPVDFRQRGYLRFVSTKEELQWLH